MAQTLLSDTANTTVGLARRKMTAEAVFFVPPPCLDGVLLCSRNVGVKKNWIVTFVYRLSSATRRSARAVAAGTAAAAYQGEEPGP